jgi:predicted protein tyrosine phosphatase
MMLPKNDLFNRRPATMNPPQKLLFICSRNWMRSLTAERMYEGFAGYEVKSAGTEPSARIPLTTEHIDWAGMIFLMEIEHLQRLRIEYGGLLDEKTLICLHIPDIYRCMEPALIEELKTKLREHVEVPE